MQFSTLFLAATPFLALVAGDACVVGGPADQVTAAKSCCYHTPGEWKQYYPVQAICVVANSTSTTADASPAEAQAPAATSIYTACVHNIDGQPLDLKCIKGENGLDKVSSKRDAAKFGLRL